MILFIAVNALIRERMRCFIVQERWKHIWERHVLRKHILQKHRERLRIEHIRRIWLRVAREHLRRIELTRFRVASIIRQKNAIDQIVHIHCHLSHDFRQIVEFDISTWDRSFESRLRRLQQIDEIFVDAFSHDRLHFLHQRRRSFCLVFDLSRFNDSTSRSNQLQCLLH